MELYKTFIKNNRVVLIGHVLIYAQGIILMPIIIKTVGVTIYGGYILLFAIVGMIYGISSFGVGFKNGRFLPATEGREARRAIFYPQFCFQLLSLIFLSLIFIISYPFIDRLFFKKELIFSKWLVLPWLIFNFFYSQIASYFVATHRVNHFNYATVAFPYINIALITLIYITTRSLSVNILFITQILSYILITVPLALLLFREIGLKFVLPDLKNLVEDIKLGFPLRINYIMDFFLGSSDRYIIAYFMTIAAVGYYNPGYAFGSLIIFFPRVSSVVLRPLLSKAIDAGKEIQAHTMIKYTIKVFLLLAIPFVAGITVLSGPLLNLFANSEVSQKAYMITPIIAVATLFFGLNIILSNILWVRMKTSIILKMNVLAAFINIVLNIVFLYIFKNILVAAVTTLISYSVAFIFIRRAATIDWPLCFERETIIKSIFAAIFMGVILYCISLCLGNNIYKIRFILSEILIGIAIYSFSLFIMKAFSRKELLYFKKAFS